MGNLDSSPFIEMHCYYVPNLDIYIYNVCNYLFTFKNVFKRNILIGFRYLCYQKQFRQDTYIIGAIKRGICWKMNEVILCSVTTKFVNIFTIYYGFTILQIGLGLLKSSNIF